MFAQESPSPAPAESPEQAIQRDLSQQEAILTNPNSKPEQREQAAERLVLRQRPDARDILLKALREADRPAQVAVAKALANDAKPDPRFIDPLLAILGRDWTATEAAVSALANYSDNADLLANLISFAANGTQVPKSRIAVIRGIGSFVKKNAAAFLIGLINNVDEDSQVRNVAADALVDMTGLQQIGRDVQQWNAWWAVNANQPDREWETAQFRNRAAHYAQVKREFERLSGAIADLLTADFRRAPDAQRSEMVLGWLKSSESLVRVVAARIVKEQKLNGERIPPLVIEQLRGMIGDSSIEVRNEAILALGAINDAASVNPLLAQLAVETEPDIKIVIASTLARLGQVKAVDALLLLLNGPVTRVAEAAGEALRDLGESIRQDPALLAKVLASVRAKLQLIGAQSGTENLRGILVETLAQLHDDSMLNTYLAAVDANNPRNTVRIRIAAAKGLGIMTAPNDKDQAANELVNALRRDTDEAVRLAAAKAIGNVGSFARVADALYEQSNAPREPDNSVRDMAWATLANLFDGPDATANVLLSTWLDRFKDDPALRNDPKKRQEVLQRRLVVLKAANDKLIKDAAKDPQAARTQAGVQQTSGEAYMALGQWAKAAASFDAAILYWQKNNGLPVVLTELSKQYIDALLRSGNYAEAVDFAAKRIAADPQAQGDMGFRIRSEVERLMKSDNPEDLKNAIQLIDETEKMQPQLSSAYSDQLKQYREEIRQRSASSEKSGK